MNPEKLKILQERVRIGGKGSARRKKKVVHRSATSDDKKVQNTLKKMGLNQIPGIEDVNIFREDGQVIHFTNPKVQALLPANSFAISGHPEIKPLTDLLPDVLNQLGTDSLSGLKQLAQTFMPGQQSSGKEEDEDEVPELTGDFEQVAKADA